MSDLPATLIIRSMSVSINPPSLVRQIASENGVQHLEHVGRMIYENGFQPTELLPASNDDHGGVIVDMKEPMDPTVFLTLLRASLSEWRRQGKKGIWIKLPIGLVNLVEAAVKEGFWYHHAEPDYLMLVYWIPRGANTIPANASHRVGIGAIVMNAKREVLVVQEKNGKLRGTGVWKIPTGAVEEGEDIFMAAMREVKEETGIDTEFVEILAFRQLHKSFFEKSDLFFLCILNPLSFDVQKQDLEIEAAQWMPFEEYAAQPIAQKHELFKYINKLCLAKVHGDYAGFTPRTISSVFTDRMSHFYFNSRDVN
ncbi:nudix hydrolase 2-like [Malania oleifera]|uniref:nudix hydrolase 2-like n=1 Tax=Malania oleifera TaxID=397392 RepID=UPI0025AE2FBE|nr:nudix hydrolase 2-like [Malania oleifera]XP_057978703.1 nudix hydrolase 2-like [Malania oleifera]XP_057978711.1 nudix hydrolase 2-like [Malania oleifera]